MIVAFDLDGTLADITHRLHFIQHKPPDWPAFYRACVYDVPVNRVIRIAEAMYNAGHTVEIWSGRSDEVKSETTTWLASQGVKYHTLRMRKAGDYRQDALIKGEWFDTLEVQCRPTLAFDDRQQVVDMWRSKGVLCAQVAEGKF